ncbi:hypothetical protein POM88_016808 [Heracleum sosnowskyi]|uniref:Uncharacterized protein n=1 Tax=Heracleum sosnowskyi TaxID=360622 RepID=A0AAD8IRC7_9APIA|nr:hypothetical protein POM88_016808 [Heracleum sosnowskyi]
MDWWGFSNRPGILGKSQFWSSFNWLNNPRERMDWANAVSSTVWSLWLNRNVKVLESINYSAEEIAYLVKVRTQKWCQSSSLLNSENLVVWNVNPLGAIINSTNALSRDLIVNGCALFGFADGSFKIDSNGFPSAGI